MIQIMICPKGLAARVSYQSGIPKQERPPLPRYCCIHMPSFTSREGSTQHLLMPLVDHVSTSSSSTSISMMDTTIAHIDWNQVGSNV